MIILWVTVLFLPRSQHRARRKKHKHSKEMKYVITLIKTSVPGKIAEDCTNVYNAEAPYPSPSAKRTGLV